MPLHGRINRRVNLHEVKLRRIFVFVFSRAAEHRITQDRSSPAYFDPSHMQAIQLHTYLVMMKRKHLRISNLIVVSMIILELSHVFFNSKKTSEIVRNFGSSKMRLHF